MATDLVGKVAACIAAVASDTTEFEFDFELPSVGEYKLFELRRLCEAHGRTRFAVAARNGDLKLRVSVSRVHNPQPPLIALSMLVRDDTAGFERAILTALSQVDEISVSVDGRSNAETLRLAELYADTVVVLQPGHLDLTEEEWSADRIHFAKARNASRALVKAPWALVIDADEVLRIAEGFDLRAFVATLDDTHGAVGVAMGSSEFAHRDPQRLARSSVLYYSSMHNQLPVTGKIAALPHSKMFVMHDISLRSEADNARRRQQREVGIEDLVVEGRKGDLPALFHAAKHFMGYLNAERGVPLVEYYRLRTEIHGPYVTERVWLALSVAAYYMHSNEVDLRKAEQWAVRALLDGPRIEAFAMLGDIAEDEGDLHRARLWYECACAIEPNLDKFTIHDDVSRRFGRRDGLRKVLFNQPRAIAKTDDNNDDKT